MSTPLSPAPVSGPQSDELPAYIANGLVGLRVLDIPMLPGMCIVSGFAGMHPQICVEAAAQAPYPLAGDIGINGAFLRGSPDRATFTGQRYDFANGELTTNLDFRGEGATADVEVLTFCSKVDPTIVVQEIAVRVSTPCDLTLRAIVDLADVPGRMTDRTIENPSGGPDQADGAIEWESLGALTLCGIAYVTELIGDGSARREVVDRGAESAPTTEYSLRARPDRTYRLRQIISIIPSRLHRQPAAEAQRLVCRAADTGFEQLRQDNRERWAELWRGRVLIDAADSRWQELADAAFFYLNTSVHPSSPASTSIFGLAQWNNYHYYYGHVMWDIELFCVPPLLLAQPDAARAILEYRTQSLDAARANARLYGRQGIQFPWESGPLNGDEVSPGAGRAAWHEDHVSLDVAWAFAQAAHVTGDQAFLGEQAAPVLFGVADWICSRVTRVGERFIIEETMGIAERKKAADNDAYTIMSARTILREAITVAERVGRWVKPAWIEVLAGLELPVNRRTGVIPNHDGYRPNEEKGATPGPLAGIFPVWYDLPPRTAKASLDYYLALAPGYVGSPMLSALYPVWATWAGDRALALRLLEQGYADLINGRFLQTLEVHPQKFPETPKAGPFFANLGGFLMALMYGLPGIRASAAEPSAWAVRPVVLPQGWRSIEIDRAWMRQQPASIVAGHGASRAEIQIQTTGTGETP